MAKDRSRVSSWRAIVLTRVDALRSQIAALPKPLPPEGDATVREIENLLACAHDAGVSYSPRIRGWWSGANIERAWRSVHNAEALLVSIQPTETIQVRYPDVLACARQMLASDDQRRKAIEQWLSDPTAGRGEPTDERARYAASLRWVSDASDNAQARVRSFRNVLLAVTLAMSVVAIGLVIVGMVAPEALPVCVAPTTEDTGVVGGQQVAEPICPTGGTSPSGGDVPLVAFVGLIGAALASAVAIRNIHGTSTPYSIPLALAALKLPTGALTAIAGLILIQGEFVPGLSALDNPAQVLAYSIVLGYAQELFTRVADRQGQTLLNSVPGPDPLATRSSDDQSPAGPRGVSPEKTAPAVPASGGPGAGAVSPNETEPAAVPSPGEPGASAVSPNETEPAAVPSPGEPGASAVSSEKTEPAVPSSDE